MEMFRGGVSLAQSCNGIIQEFCGVAANSWMIRDLAPLS
jgi:hypothetical protein